MFSCTVEDNWLPVLYVTLARLLPSVKLNIHVNFCKLCLGIDHFCVLWIRVCHNFSNGAISLQDNFLICSAFLASPHGAAIFYSHPPSSVNNMRQTGQQMLQMLFEGLPNIPLTIVTFKPRNTYMPTCINLLSVELSGQNKRQTMFVEMSIRLPFVNKWIRRTRRNS